MVEVAEVNKVVRVVEVIEVIRVVEVIKMVDLVRKLHGRKKATPLQVRSCVLNFTPGEPERGEEGP